MFFARKVLLHISKNDAGRAACTSCAVLLGCAKALSAALPTTAFHPAKVHFFPKQKKIYLFAKEKKLLIAGVSDRIYHEISN